MKTLEHLTEQVRRSYYWISFDPEKRGDRTISSYSEELDSDILKLKELEATEAWINTYKELYEKKFKIWISAQSRCISSAITGPAKFPVEKARKRNEMSDRRYKEFRDWRDKSLKSSERFKHNKDSSRPVNEHQNKEFAFDGGMVIYNYEIDRIQIKHDSKPEQIIIDTLKSRGFRWSPHYKVWQRQLTDNAAIITGRILNLNLNKPK